MTEQDTLGTIRPGYEFHENLVSDGIADLLNNAPVFQKQGRIQARIVTKHERIATYIDGVLETEKDAFPGDAVVKNPGGEEYALEARSFNKRYDPDPLNPGWYISKGKIRAIPNPYGHKIAINAPWGEIMYGSESCYLVTTVDIDTEEVETPGKIYIIDGEAFLETYKPKVAEEIEQQEI